MSNGLPGGSPAALRVLIVGHASPRWRGAVTATEASRLNAELATRRVANTESYIRAGLQRVLGTSTPIDVATHVVRNSPPSRVEIGTLSRGSAQTLREADGDLSDNSQSGRRVDVAFTSRVATQSQSVNRRPARLRAEGDLWYVRLDRAVLYVMGAAYGGADITVWNFTTGRTARFTVTLYGGGMKVNPKDALKAARKGKLQNAIKFTHIGNKFIEFTTDSRLVVSEFDGAYVRLAYVKAGLGVSSTTLRLSFEGFGAGASDILIDDGFGLSLPKLESFLCFGALRRLDPNDDADYYDVNIPTVSTTTTTAPATDVVQLFFDTASAELTAADKTLLDREIGTWAANAVRP